MCVRLQVGMSHMQAHGHGVPVCSPAEIPAPGTKASCILLLPQAHSCTRKDFEKMYPAFPKFCAIREKLDPTGMFLNAYLEKVFY